MRHYIALSIAISIFLVPWLAVTFPEQSDRIALQIRQAGSQLAAVLTHNPRTVDELQKKYVASTKRKPQKVKVLIVPGHEPEYGGTEFGNLKEREMNVELGEQLALFLSANEKYEVIMTRTRRGWVPALDNYFKTSWNDIISWQKAHKAESIRRVVAGEVRLTNPKVYHNDAPDDVAYRLYGITKWSNENSIDIAVHIHFNDARRRNRNVEGEYSGFSIYTPEHQYANGTTTRALAETVFKRLQRYNAVSDLPGESDGIIEERELIAVGANNTADAASMLIEYGYIYEPQFVNGETRRMAIKDLAFQTYLGLEDFFNPKGSATLAATYDTLIFPYTWNKVLADNGNSPQDVFALQTALLKDGVYPPENKNKNDCPRTGTIGPCTKASIEVFKKKYGITEVGVGEKTILELNRMYSGK